MEDTRERSRYFEIPPYSYFEAGNFTTGSAGGFNFRIDLVDGHFTVKLWDGILCSELSETTVAADFATDEAGYREMVLWLDERYETFRAAPRAD
ncbi:MAG: hypothetical protein NC084_11490 [Bacteroides sp.]|nr:hypothetical protein [Eubacterium sp.]MCM1419720.1 hypothetical protein [Roseburia sp.]MCM1463314.1 hypothetical protein [Bacteroides sp.]